MRVNKDLLPFKLYFLTFFMAHFGVQSYRTLFFKQLYLSAFQTGILLSILPITHLVFTPVLAYFADMFKKIKLACLVCTASFALMEFLSAQATEVSNIPDKDCLAMLNSSATNQSDETVTGSDNTKAFTYLLVVTTVGGILSSAALVTATTLTLQNLMGKYENFGYQYLYTSVGFLISTLIIGGLLHLDKEVQAVCNGIVLYSTNYAVSLYVGSTLYVVAFFTALFFKEQESEAAACSSTFKNLRTGLSPQMLVMLVACLYGGLSYSMIKGLLFWHLKNLGGTQNTILLVTVLNGAGQILGCLVLEYILLRIGHVFVICTSLVVFALRFMTYLLLRNPWVVLSVECLDGLSTSWLQITATSYVGLIPGANTAAQSLVHICFDGLGPGLGFVLGGALVSNFGYRLTFGIFACLSILVLIIFYFLYHLFSRDSDPPGYHPVDTQERKEEVQDTR